MDGVSVKVIPTDGEWEIDGEGPAKEGVPPNGGNLHPPDVNLPLSDVNPPTSDVNPPTSDVNPPTSDVNPPTSDVNPHIDPSGQPSSQMNIILGLDTGGTGYGFDLQEHNAICQMFGINQPDENAGSTPPPNIEGGDWMRRYQPIYPRRYPLLYGTDDELTDIAERLIVIYGIPECCNELKIVDAAREYGEVVNIRLLENPNNGRFLGIALCEFVTKEMTDRCQENTEYHEYSQFPDSMMLHKMINGLDNGIVTGVLSLPTNLIDQVPLKKNSLDADAHIPLSLIYDIIKIVFKNCCGSVCRSVNDVFCHELALNPNLFGPEPPRAAVKPPDESWVTSDIQKAMRWVISKNMDLNHSKRPSTTGRLNKKRSPQFTDSQSTKTPKQ